MNNRKKMYITIGIIIVLVVAAVVVTLLVRQKDNAKEQTNSPNQLIDTDKHIGVVGVVTKEKVTDSFKGLVANINGPEQSGSLVADPNLVGETARFTAETAKNNHKVYIDVNMLVFKDKQSLEKADTFAGTHEEKIDGLGDEARYYTPRSVGADHQIAVIVVKGVTSYKFSLTQSYNDGIDITRTAAEKALVALARKATFPNNK